MPEMHLGNLDLRSVLAINQTKRTNVKIKKNRRFKIYLSK